MDRFRSLAEAAAVLLGGVAGVGFEVHSDADMAAAVGFALKFVKS